MRIDGAFVRLGKHSPNFVHQLLAGENPVWIGQQFVQQIEFLLLSFV